jgi:Tol biopolymer transport system component
VYHEALAGDPIFVADPSGNNPKQIFAGRVGEHAHFPTWSPDGRYIYFARGFRATESDVWRIPAAGGNAERITHHSSKVAYPTLLDDRTLLYTGTAEDGSAAWLYAMDLQSGAAHRANLGVEHYISIAASAGPSGPLSRLVATVANPRGTLWTAPISGGMAGEAEVRPLSLPTVRAVGPRFGPNFLLYLTSKGGGDGLWKFQDGAATELWRAANGILMAPPAVSPDGNRICVVARRQRRQQLYLMSSDGTAVRSLAEALDVRDAPCWSPDGKWIAAAADQGEGGRIYRIPVDGGEPERLTEELSYNPVWSPDGRLILYAAPQQGIVFPLKAITPDRKPVQLPDLGVTGEGGRFRFLPDGKRIVLIQGWFRHQDFWLVNVETGERRRLTNLKPGSMLRNFDISPDGKQIVFDRIEENSDIVLIELARK